MARMKMGVKEKEQIKVIPKWSKLTLIRFLTFMIANTNIILYSQVSTRDTNGN